MYRQIYSLLYTAGCSYVFVSDRLFQKFNMLSCRLCTTTVLPFCSYQQREYYRCPECFLIQLKRDQCPSPDQELEEYLLHKNDPFDNGYRHFLSKVTNPMLEWLERQPTKTPAILDFGSGPGPTIAAVLAEQGWRVTNYDPFFAPSEHVLQERYDLISCTEVVEHFHEPKSSWDILLSLLTQKGHLVVMTQPSDRYYAASDFKAWRYIREKSHIAFYHSQTMQWIANTYELELSTLSPSVFWFSHKATFVAT